MANPTVPRQAFLEWVLSRDGCPYLWGGKGYAQWTKTGLQVHGFADTQHHPIEVFDCAGLLTAGLHALNGPDWRAGRGAHDLATLCTKVSPTEVANGPLKPGTVACYGDADEAGLVHISHVMVVAGDGRVFGACGGGRDTLDPDIAKRQGAKVRYRPRLDYRRDLRWFIHLPLVD